MDWIDAVGYGHEVLHTAVLEHLLGGEHGAEFVGQLVEPAASVAAVRGVTREARLRGRRPIDLAVELADGRLLAVEVKVDSAWSAEQLEATVPLEMPGVLLALGNTALAATEGELAAIDGSWRLLRPAAWAELVARFANGDQELKSYVGHVRTEARRQEDALQRVRIGEAVQDGRNPAALEHWAYFHEVVEATQQLSPEPTYWERKTLISGPLLTRWLYSAASDSEGAFLEFMGEGARRSLKVKCWASAQGQLAALQARVADSLDDPAAQRARLASARDKTCTALGWDLRDCLPGEAAQLGERLAAHLNAIWA